MKKIGYLLMVFISMFVLNSIVKAEEVTCVYAATYEGLANSHYNRNNNNDPVLKKLGIPNGSIVNVRFNTEENYTFSAAQFNIVIADGFNYEEYYKQKVTVVNTYLRSEELSIRPLSGQGLAEWYKTKKECPKYLMVDYIGSLYSSKGYIGYVTEENYDSYTYSGNSVNSENHFEVFVLYDTKVTSTPAPSSNSSKSTETKSGSTGTKSGSTEGTEAAKVETKTGENKSGTSSNTTKTEEDEYYNFEELAGVSCGKIENIPSILPRLLSVIYIIVQIAVPVLLVVLGMMDLIKSITANKDDEIKKAQGMFFKRLVSAVLVFFAFTLVKIVISAVSNDTRNLVSCMDCFIRNNCNKNGAWNCTIGEYTFSYHSDGSVGFVGTEGYNGGYGIGNIISEFKPSTNNKCPSSDEYTVVRTTSKKVGAYDFKIVKK